MGQGTQIAIITLAEFGVCYATSETSGHFPALRTEILDPTGAGDTFAGGFIGHLAATDDISFENMKRAVIHGSAMASFCVEKFGSERLLNL